MAVKIHINTSFAIWTWTTGLPKFPLTGSSSPEPDGSLCHHLLLFKQRSEGLNVGPSVADALQLRLKGLPHFLVIHMARSAKARAQP